MYRFRVSEEDEEDKALYGDWVYGVNGGSSEEKYALFFGKVRRLFGDNDSFSDDWENMYNYQITAEGERGEKLYFMIYHGSGGPSVATPCEGELTPEYQQARKELIEYIEAAEPVDYVWESIYYDIPVNIKYIVKDGKAAVESTMPDFDEDYL